jgi:hypothetical protein
MENIIASRFIDIKDLPTTTVEVLDASHTDPSYVVARVNYTEWDIATGAETQKSVTVRRDGVVGYRQSLLTEKNRVQALFDNLNTFIAVVQPLVTQWLIDHPPEPEP